MSLFSPSLLPRSLLAILLAAFALPSIANDSAASTAAGGIRLKKEARISIEKERLFISQEKVEVEYEFLNGTGEDISTEVAFPVPPYQFEFDDPGGPRGFDDFRVWVEGQEIRYQTEVHATRKGADYTELLNQFAVDIPSFGHFDDSGDRDPGPRDFEKLAASDRRILTGMDLFRGEENRPAWTVEKTYYWAQVFPAHQILRVRHEYKPVRGFNPVSVADLDSGARARRVAGAQARAKADPESSSAYYMALAQQIDGACVDAPTQKALAAGAARKYKLSEEAKQGDVIDMFWIDYILTTANNWKTPIRNFELVVERPKPDKGSPWYMSFCWDGKIERQDADHFAARAANFVPAKELHIAFFSVD